MTQSGGLGYVRLVLVGWLYTLNSNYGKSMVLISYNWFCDWKKKNLVVCFCLYYILFSIIILQFWILVFSIVIILCLGISHLLFIYSMIYYRKMKMVYTYIIFCEILGKREELFFFIEKIHFINYLKILFFFCLNSSDILIVILSFLLGGIVIILKYEFKF